MKIAGVVLAGGQSSRYGQPKMFELFAGLPLYKQGLIALQKNQLHPLIIATNASLQSKFVEEDVQWSIEKQPHQGPLFALHHIMTNFPEVEWFFIIASDMPFIHAEFVQTMLTFIDDRYEAIVPKQASRLQPLAALYRRSALTKAHQLVQQNKRSMKVLLEQLQVCYVPFEDDSSTFININSQQDWLQTFERKSNNE
ncbi:molybdopterin-guanine dinucleotide biosynthesis protein MobA [Lysinibacillus sphaericus]|uniref:molybdenum cofactor guanylyltransferase n=1 Tax=Lysinibacillus sphaericus TaxID=1421 RepID=UPI0018CF6B90|nr:molybdenum cofactor guanylyltransferase [Lysinibacillus sphaericus]MBG9453493.1 molybdopterin-guanine dinucleotide biosynthesis protein MobA [Lysinibacillus sphaericus]MBG9480365.1 molybdopterin-guanine dinucleotide biosynthesis protein MobA [Lysinibacillus sphaericus]MBG9595044.1 molybdopterin-guanine dinucleotide biosynthesis protein MobA [Lysinibacillus sphaericus]